ncbi:hypothetical protein CWB99_06000 [Pseudoalteromonas rubra]|uniref:Lipoprotein n=1 Tax=Pseudoalteromonas rubra TaxID=43658 RepID=A0A5S3WQ20_9GAMM|nr:hypothetical protein [Pseudoalteromonas rubra]TMP30029.1 hypothetical protein CWC00_18090 [Pseudoalteromonas rubra]TMP30609.1 hypothetical protein CWB99_06000 [Pseudoalteromonas rubra]
MPHFCFKTTRAIKQQRRLPLLAALSLLVSACSSYTSPPNGVVEKLYDFDHKVHYEQIKYNDDHYYLQIKSDSYQHFLQQSVFLLRHSQRLCQGQLPQLVLIEGIQGFDRLPTYPRPYEPDLQVEVRCVKNPQ